MSEQCLATMHVKIPLLTSKRNTSNRTGNKHSRNGLLGMVQRRKRLLKYLRRTEWDSYCFVLSKLGLRYNPRLVIR
ncbi:hypothetical protein I3842_02G157700 [Carya illinoinensis]|uniref:Ribosomal protein S15 n=1 Tax=Carya illinoinensis TaxID=32201 RepID=A0A922FYW4_CARIL|nr:hypothetical protein I3842_02G157700 [Carya illinoinensis]